MLVSYPCSSFMWMALALAIDWDNINNWVFGTWEQALTCAGGLGRSRTLRSSSPRAWKISSSRPVIQTLCFGRIHCSFLSFPSLDFFFFLLFLKDDLKTHLIWFLLLEWSAFFTSILYQDWMNWEHFAAKKEPDQTSLRPTTWEPFHQTWAVIQWDVGSTTGILTLDVWRVSINSPTTCSQTFHPGHSRLKGKAAVVQGELSLLKDADSWRAAGDKAVGS